MGARRRRRRRMDGWCHARLCCERAAWQTIRAKSCLRSEADRGTPTEEPIPPGPRSLCPQRAHGESSFHAPDVLDAYHRNGVDLSREHGIRARDCPRSIIACFFQMADPPSGMREPFQGLLADSVTGIGMSRWTSRCGALSRDEAQIQRIARHGPRNLCRNRPYTVFGACMGGARLTGRKSRGSTIVEPPGPRAYFSRSWRRQWACDV